MNKDVIIASLLDQFDRSLRMFRNAITSFPADEWLKGDMDYLRPAGVAYHVVESIEFYTGEVSVDEFVWGGRFGCDWEDSDSLKLPTQKQVLQYLDEVWPTARVWLETCNPSQPETLFSWTCTVLHGKHLYLLRHIQHHVAEMSLELKRRGYESPEWR